MITQSHAMIVLVSYFDKPSCMNLRPVPDRAMLPDPYRAASQPFVPWHDSLTPGQKSVNSPTVITPFDSRISSACP